MKLRQRFILCVVPLLTLFSLANNALASCPFRPQGPPCQEYWYTEAVFIGVASRVARIPDSTGAIGPYARTTVYFTVEEAFKGVGGTGLAIELDHCGFSFKEGERYLVYAHRNPNSKELDVREGNTRTRPLSEAAEDLQYIRGLSSAESGSRIFGKVTQFSYNINKNDFDSESLQNIKVILEGNNHQREVLSDSQGKYEFKHLPTGTYRIRAELPTYLNHEEQKITVNGRGCGPLNFSGRHKGQIAGHVFDNKGRLAGIPVSLVAADARPEEIFAEDKDKTRWPYSLTDLLGQFSFSQLPPGRYLLIINRTEYERSPIRLRDNALPRLFYPGVIDISGATVIVVGKDDERREYDFRVPVQ